MPRLLFFRLTLLFALFVSGVALGQSASERPQLNIRKATAPIQVDGILEETDWQSADVAKNFYQNFPADTSLATSITEVRVTYDQTFFYVSAVCYDEVAGDYIVQSLKRDFTFRLNDVFAVFIEPYNDQTNGFSFAVNPYGAQREALLQNGGNFGEQLSWDNRWFSEVKRLPGKWVVEMAIPFKTLRYKENTKHWRINFARNDLKRNENSSWSPVPRNLNVTSLAFCGDLYWDDFPRKAGLNVSLIPSVNGGWTRDLEAPQEDSWNDVDADASLDAKLSVTSSLNLDLTVNPDFSQVEVDQQQTNLTRFSLFFPERRNFFLENSDLFANFGFRQIRPFFSRRIGLNSGQPVTILGGARLSGKIDNNWRIGLLNMQTSSDTALGLEAQNYTAAAFQRQVFGASTISGIFVNRQGFEDSEVVGEDYNRVAGLDFNLASNDGRWRGKAFYHTSFEKDNPDNSYAHASWLMFDSRKVFWMWNHEYVGENYNAEVGFVPRNTVFNPETEENEPFTYWRLEPEVQYRWYPKSKKINRESVGVYYNQYSDEDLETTDYLIRPEYNINFLNTSRLSVGYSEIFTKLFFDTDVTFTDNNAIPSGRYHYRNGWLTYSSDNRRKLQADVAMNYGSFYLGDRLSVSGEIRYRLQPWGIISISVDRNEIRQPQPYGDAFLTLIGSKAELSFTRSLFFTTFIQYNTQRNNLNINSRFQWRFKPMSDLFVVYTNNYDQHINEKNRALVVKLVYWITL